MGALRACVVLGAALAVSGCGYRVLRPSSGLPEGIAQAWVPMADNLTAEPQAEVLVTQALRERLGRAGALGDSMADAKVKASLEAVSVGVLVASPNVLPSYELTGVLALRLERGGRVLTSARVVEREGYLSGADVLLTEANRQAALRRLAETLAKEGWDALRR